MNFSLFYAEVLRLLMTGTALLLAVATQALVGCTTLPQKDVKSQPGLPRGSGYSSGTPSTSVPPQSSQETPTLGVPPETQAAPAIDAKAGVSVGIILGPGGLKTLAQIGVLRELERAQIPIRGVVGLEWGALIGGLFSSRGRANDVEWQLSKLKAADLPQSGRIFGSEIRPVAIDRIASFLDQVTAGRSAHEGRIGFSCPFLEVANDFVQWADQGTLKDAVMSCLSFPPIFEAKQRVASPFAFRAAVKWLRNHGAQKVVVVNVLPSGEVTQSQNYAGGQALEFLWREVRNQMRLENEGVDWTIDISTRGYSFHEVENLRSLVALGSKVTAAQIPSMKKRLGL